MPWQGPAMAYRPFIFRPGIGPFSRLAYKHYFKYPCWILMYGVALKLGMILRSTVTFAAGYGEVTVGRRLFQLLVEPQHAEPQNGHPENRQRQHLRPKGIDTGALQKDPADDLHEVPYRIEEGQPLGELRHVADRKRKSTQH